MFRISSKYLPEAPLCTMSLCNFPESRGARRMTSGIMPTFSSSDILALAADADMFGARMVTLAAALLLLLVVSNLSILL